MDDHQHEQCSIDENGEERFEERKDHGTINQDAGADRHSGKISPWLVLDDSAVTQ